MRRLHLRYVRLLLLRGPREVLRGRYKSDTDKFARWHRGMLEEGVYLAPSQYEAGFTGLKHTEEDIDFTIRGGQARHGPHLRRKRPL